MKVTGDLERRVHPQVQGSVRWDSDLRLAAGGNSQSQCPWSQPSVSECGWRKPDL